MKDKSADSDAGKKQGLFARAYAKVMACVSYCSKGVWNDPRNTFGVRLVKTGNLSICSFFDRDLQTKAMALTYSTVLAIVPALALLVAIGRGFGLQNMLQNEIYNIFPSQHRVLSVCMQFVDSYLNSATQGLFVGVGIIVLLWTLISLLSQIEDAFNSIWGIRAGRTIYQKFTDYIAICLIIPILIVCQSGISIFMSDVIQENILLPFLSPLIGYILEFVPFILGWIAFTFSYYLIPNTKIQFKYAAVAGFVAAVGFQIIQLLFINGQIYVSKYNAIYGSFAFLPLLLIWMQLSWLLLLSGCVITYSMQNVFTFNMMGDMSSITTASWHNLSLIVMAVVSKRFIDRKPPLSETQLSQEYDLPIRVVGRIADHLRATHLVYDADVADGVKGITPAREVETLTVGEFFKTIDRNGNGDSSENGTVMTARIYTELLAETSAAWDKAYGSFDSMLVKDLPLPSPEEIKRKMLSDAD